MFCGALTYADDVTILGPSLMSLNLLLDMVNKFGDEYHVLFNASKTKSACHLGTIIGKIWI